jgi:hypothetical protein
VFSDKSAMLFVFVSLDSAEKCMHLFQAIVDAKRAGETVFYLSDYLKKQMPVQDALKSGDIPTA